MEINDLLAIYKELTKAQNNLIGQGRYCMRLQDLISDIIDDIDNVYVISV